MEESDVSDRIRLWLDHKLKASGKSQTELAQALGLSPSAVSRILKGDRQISASELIQAAMALNASMIEIDTLMADTISKALGADAPSPYANAYSQNKDYQRDVALQQMGVYTGDQHPLTDPNLIRVVAYEDEDVSFIPKSFLNIRLNEEHLLSFRWMRVPDDSMEPSLSQGDIIIFGLTEFDQRYIGLFVVEQPDGFTSIRRIEPSFAENDQTRVVIVKTDNVHYSSYRMSLAKLKIVGRVLARVIPVMR